MVHNGEEDIEAGAFITGKHRERRGKGGRREVGEGRKREKTEANRKEWQTWDFLLGLCYEM